MKVKFWYSDAVLFIVGSPKVNIENKRASLSGYFFKVSLLDPILIYLISLNDVGTIFAAGIISMTTLLLSMIVSSNSKEILGFNFLAK